MVEDACMAYGPKCSQYKRGTEKKSLQKFTNRKINHEHTWFYFGRDKFSVTDSSDKNGFVVCLVPNQENG